MWTYLAILMSLIVFVGVFFRRLNILLKGGEAAPAERPKEEKEIIEEKDVSRKDRQAVNALCEKAESKMKLGKEDEAVKLLVQALALDELHEESQHKLAMLYMKKQMFSSASALFSRLAEVTGEAVHYSHLGLAYFHQQDMENAKEAYQKAVDLDPSRPQRFVSLAQVYRVLNQLEEASLAMKKAVKLDTENINFLLLLADIQKEMRNKVEAIEILEGVLALEKTNLDAIGLLKEVRKMEDKQESQN